MNFFIKAISTHIILLKFLPARDFKVKEAMTKIKNVVIWRNKFGIESLVEEDLEIPELRTMVSIRRGNLFVTMFLASFRIRSCTQRHLGTRRRARSS